MERWSFNSHFYDKENSWQTIHEKPLLLRHTNRESKTRVQNHKNGSKHPKDSRKTSKNKEKSRKS